MAVKSNEIINSIKFLAFDMMDKAGEGNPGHTLTGVPIFYALYSNVLNVIPSNPSFINRDRLIVTSKNYSAALYATLFYAGYDYQIEDLKRYRDVDSYAPGALLYNKEMGIDASSSLAGDNTSLAVGVSLSERYFESMTIVFDINRNKSCLPDIQVQRRFIPELEIEDLKTYNELKRRNKNGNNME